MTMYIATLTSFVALWNKIMVTAIIARTTSAIIPRVLLEAAFMIESAFSISFSQGEIERTIPNMRVMAVLKYDVTWRVEHP